VREVLNQFCIPIPKSRRTIVIFEEKCANMFMRMTRKIIEV